MSYCAGDFILKKMISGRQAQAFGGVIPFINKVKAKAEFVPPEYY